MNGSKAKKLLLKIYAIRIKSTTLKLGSIFKACVDFIFKALKLCCNWVSSMLGELSAMIERLI